MGRFAKVTKVVAVAAVVALGACGSDDKGGSTLCGSVDSKLQSCWPGVTSAELGEPCTEPTGFWASVEKCETECALAATCDVIAELICTGIKPPALDSCYAACTPPDFVCADGSGTFPYDYQCDGWDDCTNASDEAGCPVPPEPAVWACVTGNEYIFADDKCDGWYDCADGSDETTATCGSFTCTDSSVIPANLECDWTVDCLDGSDEHQGCAYVTVCGGI